MKKQQSLLKKLQMANYLSTIPVIFFFLVMLFSLVTTTLSYDKIVRKITEANRYSVSFKGQIDNTMYLVVANGCSVENLKKKAPYEEKANPYSLIQETRDVFTDLDDISTTESRKHIKVILQDLNNLEKVCLKVEESAQERGHYDENMKLLDLNVYILTDLIQEQIQEYIFYEAKGMETLRKSLYGQTLRFVLLFLVVFLVYMSLTTRYNHNVLKSAQVPITELKGAAEAIGKGNFSVRLQGTYDEEFTVLAASFNQMSQEIQSLISTTKKEQENLRSYELRLYQAQINPHFLYNTLDTIVALVESRMPKDAIRMITYLSDFFRTTLSSGRDYITVQEEKNHVESYLEIQQMRYEDILSYSIEFDEDIGNYSILKLTLQPLVENALYHGIKEKRGKGHIQITGQKQDGKLIFRIIDDGMGMEEETLRKLQQSLHVKDDQTKSFGLYNVEQRIQLNYGPEYGVTIESEIGKGTKATITIPALFGKLS
jgi:two-component system sensor histidine kinase YesM